MHLNILKKEIRAVPDTFDWRTRNVVTPVKNQQACGSCWTFSTTGNLEGLYALKTGRLISLSEQEIVDCSTACCNVPGNGPVCNQGCNGGFMWSAMYDIMSWGGLELESQYPYLGYPNTCAKAGPQTARISNYTCISTTAGPANENQMMAYSYANGPISIALNAALLMNYESGVIDPWFPGFWCDPDTLDHALLIVGWGSAENWIGETIPYWLVKNSWGADWGENGYFRIGRGVNLCGIANSVVSANM
jgi:cathepsin F